ncbi:MAG: alpha/beta hydrolase-fold protein [Anaerolineaceae bacterium]
MNICEHETIPTKTPLIEGKKVTFYKRSKQQPILIGDFNHWDFSNGIGLEQYAPGLWKTELEFPIDAYMEYSFLQNGKRVIDPKNPQRVDNGTGDINNYIYMPEAKPSSYAIETGFQGNLTEHQIVDDIRLIDSSRRIYLYQPKVQEPCPLVVVYDGNDYLKRGHIVTIIENMVKEEKIQPLALALIPSTRARFVEYAGSDSTVSFVLNKVIPLAQKNLQLIDIQDHPGAYCILGASMGGMMALYSSIRAPKIFGKVICQSGAFRMYEEDFSIFDLVDRDQIPQIQIWMDIGKYDFLYSVNQRMYQLLKEKDYCVNYKEVNGGHNYATWRNILPQALEFLFPRQGNSFTNIGDN